MFLGMKKFLCKKKILPLYLTRTKSSTNVEQVYGHS